jgi:hypothetical protein
MEFIMELNEIIALGLKTAGYDGLCCPEIDCGCGIDCLCPCGAPDVQCEGAYRGRPPVSQRDENIEWFYYRHKEDAERSMSDE